MKQVQKQWLESVPWEAVLAVNQNLCEAQKTAAQPKPNSFEAARQIWERSVSKAMSLTEVLDICRQCQDLGPFVFNNGNTFAAISKNLIEDWVKGLPPLEAQILRTTVSHYVAGQVEKRELLQVLRHIETQWHTPGMSQNSEPLLEKTQAERPST